jgi:translation initiation factor IF-2
MRVYEIAKEVGIPNKELLAKIRALGLEVNNHMSSLDADAVQRIKKSLEREKHAAVSAPETKALGGAVLRRRSSKSDDGDTPAPSAPVAPAPAPVIRRRHVEEAPSAAAESAPVRPEPVRPEPVRVEAPRPEPVRRVEAPRPEPVRVREPEPEPEPVIESAPPPTPERVREPEPEPERIQVEEAPPPAPTPESASEPTPEPIRVEQAPPPATDSVPDTRPKSRVFVAGPAIVRGGGGGGGGGGAGEAQTHAHAGGGGSAAPAPLPQGPRPTVIVRARDNTPPPPPPAPIGPATVQEVADGARSRFEAELERARARSAEREAQRAPTPPTEPPPVAPVPVVEVRDPSRPAVGTVIKLPTRIQITERAPMGHRPSQPPPGGPAAIRGRFAEQQKKGGPRRPNDFGKKKLPLTKGKGKSTQITEAAAHKRIIRIEETIAISDLARGMGVKATEVLKKLWSMGMTGVNINASIDFETAQILAGEFQYEVQNVAFKEEDIFSEKADDADKMVLRAPVVTVMGHVDHGKTSLLDKIRNSKVAAGEAGGITQHIAAYKVPAGDNHGEIVFLDTPGHEAFTEMRARGASATDIVILVVAANDGVMPQTLEALAHAKEAKVPIIVAVNKIDLPDAQPDRIRQQLADRGLIPEEWGGETQFVNVSALKGENIDKLLETIALVAEVGELRANPEKPATGVVIEARLDRNRGPMATVLVQEGTLKVGDILVAGRCYGKVRAMLDARGQTLEQCGPSTPIEILGLDGVPEAGDQVNVAEDDKAAKQVVEHRRQSWRKRELASTSKISLENVMARINESTSDGKELKIVLKADVQGSAEALKAALVKLATEKVKVTVISAGVGGITEGDVNLAKAGGAIVLGFHVRPAGKSQKLAEQEGVEIRLYDIIYDALDEVKSAMAGLLAPIKREQAMGKLEVRNTFTIPKIGTIAGCMVSDGKITRKSLLRVIRDAVQVYEGRVGSLRRFKDDVSEVQNGYECGVQIAGFNDLKVGDVIEAYEVIEEAATL